jgi:hypothetical protein
MNPHTKLWIDALRGGAYRQTTHRLRQRSRFFWRSDAFCAIGVLYDLYLRSAGEKWPHRARHGQLPQDVLDWAEVSRELEYEVVTHNDAGTNFRDIASIVEAHFHRIERRGRWNEAGELANQLIEQARDSSQPERSAASTL